MNNKKLALSILTILLLVFLIDMLLSFPAQAQKGGKDVLGADKNLASKQGISGSLATKQFDKSRLPGKWKIGFAIGSVITAVAVVKWL